MRIGEERVGPRGMMVLGLSGLIGIGLALHGYGHGVVLGGTSQGLGATHTTVSPPPPSASGTARATVGPASTTQAAGHRPPAPAAPNGQKLGPLLSSTQYAPYAYQLYPGPASARARLATAGFNVRVSHAAGKVTVSISGTGSSQGARTTTYPAGARVYFIEATFGDDSGNADYSYG
jgi:hypothetical protein